MSGTTSGVKFAQSGADIHMTIYRGKSLRFELIWGGANPIDITGHVAALQARNAAGELMLDLSTANGRIANGGASGKLTFTATPEATRAVDAPGSYEIELQTPSGDVYRVISGNVSIVDEVVQ